MAAQSIAAVELRHVAEIPGTRRVAASSPDWGPRIWAVAKAPATESAPDAAVPHDLGARRRGYARRECATACVVVHLRANVAQVELEPASSG